MELSFNEAKIVCEIDCPANTDTKKFEANIPQIRLACTFWFQLLEDLGFSQGEILIVKKSILDRGLHSVVTQFGDLAEEVLSNSENVVDPHLLFDASASPVSWVCFQYTLRYKGDTIQLLRNLLQACLFLERFTYLHGDPTASIDKFKRVNAKCKDMEYDWTIWPGPTILDMARQEFGEIVEGKWKISLADCGFTNGSTNQTTGDYLAKWKNLSHIYPNYKGNVQYPLLGGFCGRRLHRYPKLQPVPKSMVAYRVIAPEDPCINYWATSYLACLRRVLDSNGTSQFINERDQQVNRDFALEGSLTREWCTIDMSSASDSISKAVFHAIAPAFLSELVRNVESYYVTIDEHTTKKLFTLFTSGHPLTWLLEACYFLALARVAARLCGIEDYRSHCYAYGDDLIVSSDAYQATCELLELFGHTVNSKKSYSLGYFRESCGSWFYMGVDVTPIHWPRRAVNPNKGSLAFVCTDIQHKAFGLYPLLEECSASKARVLDPKMTVSTPWTGYDDIWDSGCDAVSNDVTKHWSYGPVMRDRDREPFLDHLVYYQYLEYGPLYMSDLDRLLGVSTSRFVTYRTKGESVVTFR